MRWLSGSILIGLLSGVIPLTAGSFPAYGDLPGVVFSAGSEVPPDYSFVSLNSFENPFLQTQNGAYSGPQFDESPDSSGDVVDGGNTPFVPDPLLLLQTSVGGAPGDFQMSSNQASSPDEIGGPVTVVPEPGTLFLVWGGIVLLLVVRVIPPDSGAGELCPVSKLH